jgi:hypothetical protein
METIYKISVITWLIHTILFILVKAVLIFNNYEIIKAVNVIVTT